MPPNGKCVQVYPQRVCQISIQTERVPCSRKSILAAISEIIISEILYQHSDVLPETNLEQDVSLHWI